MRTQFAAIAYRIRKDKPEICLITSRGTGRWIVPKGWPMPGITPQDAAATEAWEEAGLEGRVHPQPLGLFSYDKEHEGEQLPVIAVVYAMRVKKAHSTWPESHQRRRKWFTPRKAASKISDPELRHIIRNFDPRHLR
ncbi:NUDIX hydrolase [Aestuariibius sp. HNIBRBA575]|uniref:NUDIX hydrolase n=1 Tax=Aestuariibius sp. HNIBRBA575 TaxID=3233343 RepID=UPI0034A39A7A